jgi:sulfate permease, SulP family
VIGGPVVTNWSIYEHSASLLLQEPASHAAGDARRRHLGQGPVEMTDTAPAGPTRRHWLLPTLAGYHRGWLGADVLAGLTAGAVVVPQAMAYATIAGLPVQVGLYTCMVPMLVYAFLGGSRAMSVSTTSTIATLTATTLLSAGVAAGSGDVPRDLVTLTLLVGVVLLAARLLRLGGLVEIINRPTMIGIQIGVGATVAVGQLPKLLGEGGDVTAHGFLRSIDAAVKALPHGHLATILLSAGSIAALFGLRRYAPRVPGPLVVVVAGILLAALGWLPGVDLIAPVPRGLPLPEAPSFAHVGALLPGALAIAVMAFLESTAVARGIREPGEPAVDSNQELLATAAANVLGSTFQALPAAGGFSQSAVNKGAGARSQVATLTTVALAVLVGLSLGSVLSKLPEATLAALVFVAVYGLIDIHGLLRLWRIRRSDFWVALATTVVGLTAGLLQAVGVGVVLTLILVLRALNRPRVEVAAAADGIVVARLLGPLYTANVLGTEQMILDLTVQRTDLRALVLDMSVVQEMTVTVLDALQDLDRELAGRGVELRIAAQPAAAEQIAVRTAWYRGLVAAGRVFPSVDAAVAAPVPPPVGPPVPPPVPPPVSGG